MSEKLINAAQAVIERWDSPQWNWGEPTAALIHDLRQAVDAARHQGQDEAKAGDVEAAKAWTESEIRRREGLASRARTIHGVVGHQAAANHLRTFLASHSAQAERVASLEAGFLEIKHMKAEAIGGTGFQTGPAAHFAACQRIARALLSGKASA